MPVVIPDEILQQTGLSEREMLIEIACRLFDAEKIALWPAAQLAGLSRSEMEGELLKRKLPIYRYTEEHFQQDVQYLEAERARRHL